MRGAGTRKWGSLAFAAGTARGVSKSVVHRIKQLEEAEAEIAEGRAARDLQPCPLSQP
jgi:hypothetical protein